MEAVCNLTLLRGVSVVFGASGFLSTFKANFSIASAFLHLTEEGTNRANRYGRP